jgi:hypothetical protein
MGNLKYKQKLYRTRNNCRITMSSRLRIMHYFENVFVGTQEKEGAILEQAVEKKV